METIFIHLFQILLMIDISKRHAKMNTRINYIIYV